MARSFAAGQFLRLDIGAASSFNWTAYTVLVLARRTANGAEQYLLATVPSGGAPSNFQGFACDPVWADDNRLLWYDPTTGNFDSTATITFAAADSWCVLALTKATGVAPRFHKFVVSTGVWTHANASFAPSGSPAAGGTAPGAGATWVMGAENDGLDVAAVAKFDADMTDAQLESFAGASLHAWLSRGPSMMAVLDQSATTINVKDWVGNANQNAATTAATVLSASPLTYGAPMLDAPTAASSATTKAGEATGAITWAGSATGARASSGAATGAITWAGSATGKRVAGGAATGAITLAGSATGTRTPKGAATGAVTWAGTATGARPSSGSSTGAVSWTGSATGTRTPKGAATGAVAWAGTATGEAPTVGDAVGSTSGAITRAGSATGARPSSGSSVGSVAWVGVVTGTRTPKGATVGTITRVGSATGEAPDVDAAEGSTTGTITRTGTATGARPSLGAAIGSIAWVGSATSIVTPTVTVTGPFTIGRVDDDRSLTRVDLDRTIGRVDEARTLEAIT